MKTTEDVGCIDAVVTWVDGSDPDHSDKRRRYELSGEYLGFDPSGLDETRFQSKFELWYCVQFILHNAPWVRRIHVVTDNQRPLWIEYGSELSYRIAIVDHRDIFEGFEDVLPTFSSRSIESVLHRIPGLSDKYLYFNDDFLLTRISTPGDWFEGGRPRFRGAWQPNRGFGEYVRRARERIRRFVLPVRYQGGLIGFRAERAILREYRSLFRLAHAPFPMTRAIAQRYLEKSGLMERNIRYRFRHPRQFNPFALMANLALGEGRAVTGPEDWGYVAFGNDDEVAMKRMHRLVDSPPLSICLQSLEKSSDERQEKVRALLDRTLSIVERA